MGKAVTEKFSKIIENLERMTDINRQRGLAAHRDISFEDIRESCHKNQYGGAISLEYFRIVRLMAWREMFGSDAPRLSYSAGEKVGRKLKAQSVSELIKMMEGFGITDVEIISYYDKGSEKDKMKIRFGNSAISSGMVFMGEPVCHFEAGLLAGALERILRKKIIVNETKCVAMGHDHCEFESDVPENQQNPRLSEYNVMELDYSEENMQLFSTLADHALTALQNAVRYEKAKKMVITDHLTKTYNSGYFHTRIKEEISRAERQNSQFCLVMIDLDGFKKLNDQFGHPAGDRILIETARIIRKNIRGIDILCRYGGDEFAVILPQTDNEEIMNVIERVRSEIEGYDFGAALKSNIPFKITASFGCAMFPDDSRCYEQLIENADHALYEAKRAGRNQLKFFSENILTLAVK